jgi:hypothetical protein
MEIILLPSETKKNLENHYEHALSNAVELYIVSAYLTHWERTYPLNPECETLRIIVGIDFGITRKQACFDVLDWLPERHKVQFFAAQYIRGFHPKAVFWREKNGEFFALAGSSNLTKGAFEKNHEVNFFTPIDKLSFDDAKAWIKSIESQSVPISQSWLKKYIEADPPKYKSKKNQSNFIVVPLPLPKFKKRVDAEKLRIRREQMLVFKNKRPEFITLFREADAKTTWSDNDNKIFFEKFMKLWQRRKDGGCRFQGYGAEISARTSNLKEFSTSIVSVLDSSEFDRDDVVVGEIGRLKNKKIPTRGALFSEMLCQFFPAEYHVMNGPVKIWLQATGFGPPSESDGGQKYLDCARKLRLALKQAKDYPAKNLAELDTLIV